MTEKTSPAFDTATQYHGLSLPEYRPMIVLHQPQMGENIGMVARAMANCGLTKLALVAPRDGWPNEKAFPASSGADHILHDATVYATLQEAVADCALVFGSCAFERELIKPVMTAETAAQAICRAHETKQKTALVFGPERTGLTKDDMALMDGVITIPLNPEFASLNLAQSVLLIGYAWWYAQVVAPQKQNANALLDILNLNEAEPATQGDMDNLFENVVDVLEEKNYFTNSQNKTAQLRNARSFLQRMRLTKQEARSAHGMLKAMMDGKIWSRKS
jgi:tRNA/rRNA methyltransferase